MSDKIVFYTNPMSRGRIIRWMLEEVGQPYETVLMEFPALKAPDFLAINPMGKVPTIRHGDTVVTEAAAICAYLADAFPQAGLAPPLGLQVAPEKQGFVGYGNARLTEDTLAQAVAGRSFIAGERFSTADLYLCAKLDFALAFGNLPKRPEFLAYCAAHAQRPAKLRAAALDDAALKT